MHSDSITHDMTTPSHPLHAGAAGRRLWESIVTDYELDEHELAVLTEAVRTVDLLDQLEAAIRSEGAIVDSPQGRKANPAAVEARQQRITLARLLAALRIPAGADGDEQSTARPRRRTGVRGTHRIRAVS